MWQLCVIGEAANQISSTLRQQTPEIAWRPMINMRNKLILDYYGIKDEEIWRVAQQDLPPLIASVRHLLSALDTDPS